MSSANEHFFHFDFLFYCCDNFSISTRAGKQPQRGLLSRPPDLLRKSKTNRYDPCNRFGLNEYEKVHFVNFYQNKLWMQQKSNIFIHN